MAIARTPQEFAGPAYEDAICFEDQYGEWPNCNQPFLYYSDGYFYAKDAYGMFNLRYGSGIDESAHENLDTLVHEIDETSYDEVVYTIGKKVERYIVWTDNGKTKKIREDIYTYTRSLVTQSISKQYDSNGILKMTVTEDYTYVNNLVSTIVRTKS